MLQDPVARNWYYAGYTGYQNNFYNEMSLNRNVLPFAAGICGGQVLQAVQAQLTLRQHMPSAACPLQILFASGSTRLQAVTSRGTQGLFATLLASTLAPASQRYLGRPSASQTLCLVADGG